MDPATPTAPTPVTKSPAQLASEFIAGLGDADWQINFVQKAPQSYLVVVLGKYDEEDDSFDELTADQYTELGITDRWVDTGTKGMTMGKMSRVFCQATFGPILSVYVTNGDVILTRNEQLDTWELVKPDVMRDLFAVRHQQRCL